jgi:hypothetical protein
MKTIFSLLLILSGVAFGQNMQRVPLKVTDAYQTNNPLQDVTFLIDSNRNTRLFSTNTAIITPHDVVFDLSGYAPCTIKRFVLYDGLFSNYNTQFVVVDTAGKEDTVFTFTGRRYFDSDTIDIPVSKQVIASKLILRNDNGMDAYPDDMEVWGSFTDNPEPLFSRRNVPIRNLMGLVVHPWDIDHKMYPAKYPALLNLNVGSIRLYSDADGNKDPGGAYAFNPQYHGGFHPEETFAQLKQDRPNILLQACYQRQSLNISSGWLAAGINSQLNFPLQYNNNIDRLKPSSYFNIAQDLFVLTERGGRNASLPDYNVWISPNWWEQKNVMVKGGNFYDAVEGGNEWNGWWAGYNGFMNGSQLAAAWSMMYDGHKGAFTNVGVKQADQTMLFTNGGIALDLPDIFHEAVDWWKDNRGYLPDGSINIPLDYYSFHCYPSASGQYSGAEGGLPPEMGMALRAKQMVYFSNKFGGRKPVYIGEWGYDVNPGSPQNAPAYGRYNAEQTRAMWAIRAICSFSEAGLDGAQWYRAYQDYIPDPRGGNYLSDNSPLQFSTMALLRQTDDNGNIIRTMVGDYFKQFSDLYGDYVFNNVLRNDSVWVLKFSKDTSYMYVVWGVEKVTTPQYSRPVVNCERTGTYYLTVPLNAIVRIRNFNDDGSGMMQSRLDVAAGTEMPIYYSAKPQIIEVAGQGATLPVQLVSFTASKMNRAVQLNWSVENEDALAGYTIERSVNQISYSPIETIEISGRRNYRVIDSLPFLGNNYYRLKLKDQNGTYKYSPVRLVVFNKDKTRYAAFNLLGQVLTEGVDFNDVNIKAKNRLQQYQPYIIKGSDGSSLKLLKQY